MEIKISYETMKRGSMGSYKIYSDYLKAWKRAGFPDRLRLDKNGNPIMDNQALRQQLDDKANPEKRRERIERRELEYRDKMNKLLYG
jgi:hypothetical protein